MDSNTLKSFFEKSRSRKPKDFDYILPLIDALEDEEPDSNVINETLNYLNNANDPSNPKEEEFGNYRLINEEFTKIIENLLIEMGTHLKEEHKMTFENAIDDKSLKYFRLKVLDNFKKITLTYIEECTKKAVFEINLKNFFESHGNNYY